MFNKIENHIVLIIAALALHAIFCTCMPVIKHAHAAAPHKILLIVMDGARYDYCTPENMPYLFSFMQHAHIFKNAYAPSSWTLPSHASLFTGLYPQQHGAFKLPYDPQTDASADTKKRFETKINIDNISIPPHANTLADLLRKAGFQTMGVFGNPCYGYPIFNLSKGFDTWINVVENKLLNAGCQQRGFYSFDYELDGKFYTVIPDAIEVAAEALHVLHAAQSTQPLFLFINFEDPIATPLYYAPQQRPEIIKNYKDYLKQSMTKIDRVLPTLLPFFEDGLVVVTSDHGQGDGTIYEPTAHGTALAPPQIRIPLLVRGSDLRHINTMQPVDLTRVFDLVLSSAGLDIPKEGLLFRPPEPAAFCHLDSSPLHPVGTWACFGTGTERGLLVLGPSQDGLVKQLFLQGNKKFGLSTALRVEERLSTQMGRFLKLGRAYPYSGKDQYWPG